eukprot:maker-scaffold_84-snap-gene-0.48-mRNA-1 protein AED:0.01 eAED:0.01 QI:85/1/1/1/1/1/2/94/312
MEKTENQKLLATALGSSTSGVLARFPCHPIDTLKSRIQASSLKKQPTPSSQTTPFRNLFKSVKTHIISGTPSQTIRSLYRGFGVTALGSAPATCLYFSSYQVSKGKLSNLFQSEETSFLVHFTSGLVAETVSCVLFVPIDVIKERMQIQKSKQTAKIYYSSTLDAVKKIRSNEGFFALYKGYGATVLSFGPFSAFYFMFYEKMKSYGSAGGETPGIGKLAAFSAVSGALASWITSPLDLVKLRLQVQRSAKAAGEAKGEYRNMFQGLALVFRNQGLEGLFRGSLVRMSFHAPSMAINMALFEHMHSFYLQFV